jgi:hypothetical protein
MFTGLRDDGSIFVWVETQAERDALIASQPDKFFTTAHYDSYPMVLVRLKAVGRQELEELIVDSWRLRAPRTLVKQWDVRQG